MQRFPVSEQENFGVAPIGVMPVKLLSFFCADSKTK